MLQLCSAPQCKSVTSYAICWPVDYFILVQHLTAPILITKRSKSACMHTCCALAAAVAGTAAHHCTSRSACLAL